MFFQKGDKESLSATDTLISSSVSKTIASIAAYPHEVLRAKLQFQQKTALSPYLNLRAACKQILVDEGIKGFYRGMGTNLLRVVPSCAITFSVYEAVLKKLRE